MTTDAVQQGRKTRSTYQAERKVPAGYVNLFTYGESNETIEIGSDWDSQWKNRETEYRQPAYRGVIARTDPAAAPDIATFASSLPPQSAQSGPALVSILFLAGQSPRATEPADLKSFPHTDWSRWHTLREKASRGVLTLRETEELERLAEQARAMDEEFRAVQAEAILPAVARHTAILSSLSGIAALLSRVLEQGDEAGTKDRSR
jgi:hypothetical protein